jgi:predicted dehydrogenase
MRLGIIGCGLIGAKRALACAGHGVVSAVTDSDPQRASALAAKLPKCRVEPDADSLVKRADLDAVVVATTHDVLAPLTLAALRAGKHVLVEKPGARNAAEWRPVVEEARTSGRIVKVGFNHRFHPAFQKAREIFDTGALGPMMFVRGRYGHGGRVGYESEWRADAARSGGGELLDQGSHLIDLSRWFLGDFVEVKAHLGTYFWKMQVEDNAFLLLNTADGKTAWLHASWSEWKNCFSFEIYGRDGKLQIEGLGGSYGTERLTHYKMLPQMGPPKTEEWTFSGPDRSWELEWRSFVQSVEHGTPVVGGAEDALGVLEVVDKAYAAAKASTV